MPVPNLSPVVLEKLKIMQEKLHEKDIETALDKSLNMAYFIANTLNDPDSKLLLERDGIYQELKGFS